MVWPYKESLLVCLSALNDGLVVGKQVSELGIVLEQHLMFERKIWGMLIEDMGQIYKEQLSFLDDNIDTM